MLYIKLSSVCLVTIGVTTSAAASIGRVASRQDFTLLSDMCLNATQWAGFNPTSYSGYYECFSRVENDDGTADIYLNNVPDHTINVDAENPNQLCQLAQKITLPKPVKTNNNTRVPQADVIAIAVNGVQIFGPLEGGGDNAVYGVDGVGVLCDGHPQPAGLWHYHHPNIDCVEAASTDLVAWALDGFPIYGPLNATKDEVDSILDDCNGIDVADSQYGYQYHVRSRAQVNESLTTNDGPNNTDNWKYFLGCYRGETYTTTLTDSTGICANETTT
ncbi:YHYH protein-domain-containing protein [Calycina marina]|uniref:YHYH protein-domain-containing protein n=1 Tax=Calycina marina TaxID=1763456 RepID=A0A9P8CBR3_9HELO|nr:YHYH protein-domain-containing protein [Calycina marina]